MKNIQLTATFIKGNNSRCKHKELVKIVINPGPKSGINRTYTQDDRRVVNKNN